MRFNLVLDATLGPFGPPMLIGELADVADDDAPSVTADLLELYFESTRFGPRGIVVSTRATTAMAWPLPALVAELTSAASEVSPEVSGDGLTMLFASDVATR